MARFLELGNESSKGNLYMLWSVARLAQLEVVVAQKMPGHSQTGN
ncbi:hypothetical protein SBA2_570017 [Acidobacteriia bacterium SbA2]|nr:hypothetical protein SBA2_570017 [Acidobacteriia bacterium SbA2]